MSCSRRPSIEEQHQITMDFIKEVYPEYTELQMTMVDEIRCLKDATGIIRDLKRRSVTKNTTKEYHPMIEFFQSCVCRIFHRKHWKQDYPNSPGMDNLFTCQKCGCRWED